MRVFDPIAADVTHPLVQLYRERLKELVDGQLKIEKAIEGLNPTERELMRLRYIDGAEWVDVAAAIHYEWTQTHRIHAKALAKIKNL
jgi:DNA-directed RNA polymerase specialized sigma24 family protein